MEITTAIGPLFSHRYYTMAVTSPSSGHRCDVGIAAAPDVYEVAGVGLEVGGMASVVENDNDGEGNFPVLVARPSVAI